MIASPRQGRAADYRDRAREAAALAEASPLQCVRERYETAAARWLELAAQSDHGAGVRPHRAAR
ncbi:MAG TPA: hypothetical protein VG407_11980 [Caulobacteraceae bacterium]|jgi:hypothetical protein|nr:hypothetical protein [Caulobacteraceae bacterium]